VPQKATAVRRVALALAIALARSFSFSIAVVWIFSLLAASPARPQRFASTEAAPPLLLV
jgi:hypothetical protein